MENAGDSTYKHEPGHHLLPNMADITSTLHMARILSKFDLMKGCIHALVYQDDVPKTAVLTPFRSYTFNYSISSPHKSRAIAQRLLTVSSFFFSKALLHQRHSVQAH